MYIYICIHNTYSIKYIEYVRNLLYIYMYTIYIYVYVYYVYTIYIYISIYIYYVYTYALICELCTLYIHDTR